MGQLVLTNDALVALYAQWAPLSNPYNWQTVGDTVFATQSETFTLNNELSVITRDTPFSLQVCDSIDGTCHTVSGTFVSIFPLPSTFLEGPL
jgi:hypothetical protein